MNLKNKSDKELQFLFQESQRALAVG